MMSLESRHRLRTPSGSFVDLREYSKRGSVATALSAASGLLPYSAEVSSLVVDSSRVGSGDYVSRVVDDLPNLEPRSARPSFASQGSAESALTLARLEARRRQRRPSWGIVDRQNQLSGSSGRNSFLEVPR